MSVSASTHGQITSRHVLAQRYRRIRSTTLRLCDPLSPEDMVVQACVETSPTKWHLAHTTWFFETFVLERFEKDFKPYDPAFRVLFNSYYQQVGDRHPRPKRGLLTRPGLGEVMAYRDMVDERITDLLCSYPAHRLGSIPDLIELGLNHEQQHQELMLMDIKRLLSENPIEPGYTESPVDDTLPVPPGEIEWVGVDGGVVEIGRDEGGHFQYDNEGPRHRRYIEPFQIASRLVNNAEYLEFVEAGGYEDAKHWLDEGWSMVCEQGLRMPLYWRHHGSGAYSQYTLAGRVPLEPDAPAVHLSFFEAEAYARWRGARLLTEAEWEAAAAPRWETGVRQGNFLDSTGLAPRRPRETDRVMGVSQLAGDAWEWTRSAHEPYPGYNPPRGPVGEYNGKFMCGSFVLRGGSCVTPRDHIRVGYRNFFHPGARWAFGGIRLARDARKRPATNTNVSGSAVVAVETTGNGNSHDNLESADMQREYPHLRSTIVGAAQMGTLAEDVLRGFAPGREVKSVPPKYLYDARGGELFDQIYALDAYYLPRLERQALDGLLPELKQRLGPSTTLIEPGAGDGTKAKHLLGHLDSPRMFVPIEINGDALARCARRIADAFPDLCVQPIRASFREGLESLYEVPRKHRLVFFPGSSIGNLMRPDRVRLLRAFRDALDDDGAALIGFDLCKDERTLVEAYDDEQGVSARFAINLIDRINRELEAGLDPAAFEYEAVWDRAQSRIEMRLRVTADQRLRVRGEVIELRAGDHIVTEYSHKFTQAMIRSECEDAGLGIEKAWNDASDGYSMCLLRRAAPVGGGDGTSTGASEPSRENSDG